MVIENWSFNYLNWILKHLFFKKTRSSFWSTFSLEVIYIKQTRSVATLNNKTRWVEILHPSLGNVKSPTVAHQTLSTPALKKFVLTPSFWGPNVVIKCLG